MAKEIPSWFMWTTTIGLAIIIVLLWLNYSATGNLGRANYAMMQGNADMNMMNSGMMQMIAKGMMGKNMMTQSEYDKINEVYSSASHMNEEMGEMMEDGTITDNDLEHMTENHMLTRNMMGGMMG